MLRAFEFQPIRTLVDSHCNKSVDVCGIIAFVGPLEKLTARKDPRNISNGVERQKRYLTILDDTLHSIDLTLWGSLATDFIADNEDQSSLINN